MAPLRNDDPAPGAFFPAAGAAQEVNPNLRLPPGWSDTYFEHLASAAAVFILGSAVWLGGVVRALAAERGDQEAGPA